MNRLVIKISLVALLGCSRVPGQNATLDCGPSEPQAPVRTELDDWLESLDRGPCTGPQKATRFGVVSARSLAHKPSRKAQQEFDRGMRARQQGRSAEALKHFAAAARLDLNFVDAHAYAGLVHVEARDASRALPYYQRAVLLEPANAALLSNLGVVLVALDRPAEAELAARRALRLDPASVEAHYVLGLALFVRNHALEEAVTHLKIAAEKYPRARQALERIQQVIAPGPPAF